MRYAQAVQRLHAVISLPGVAWNNLEQIPVKSARAIADLTEQDWAAAVAVVSYLADAGPGDAVTIRQLAIPGVHSKWIETNAALIGAMLGVPADRRLGDPLTRLIAHIGLRAPETPVHVTLACPQLHAQAAGLRRFDATLTVLNTSSLQPRTLLIIENAAPGKALSVDLPGVAIVSGLGAGAPILANLKWCATADILYWGDIDRAGLAILASVRRAGLTVRSILMDETTLDAHAGSCHDTDTQISGHTVPEELTDSEAALYTRLNTYQQASGLDLQLEQEHVPITLARNAIRAAMTAASSMDCACSVSHGVGITVR